MQQTNTWEFAMSYINTTNPEAATGEVAALYRQLQGNADYLPNYARIFSHRPGLMAHISALMKALMTPMDSRLWALVNFAAAQASGSSYCSLAFANKLIAKHFSEEEVLEIARGGAAAPLTPGERQAMAYAARVAANAAAIEQADIDALKWCGYSDAEIFDIAAAAAWRCFFARVPDSLGAAPDRALGQLPFPLLGQLLVGRPLEGESEIQQSSAKSSQLLQACEGAAE